MNTATSPITATQFKALGDATRLRIFEFLCACSGTVALGEEGEVRPLRGRTVGEVCCHVTGEEKITSTLSFHIKELRQANLIRMERNGKNMLCSVDPQVVLNLEAYFEQIRRKTDDENCACPES